MKNNTHEENVIAELKSINASIERLRRWIVGTMIVAALMIGALLSPDSSIRNGIGGIFLFLAILATLTIAIASLISSLANRKFKNEHDRQRVALLSGRASHPETVKELE